MATEKQRYEARKTAGMCPNHGNDKEQVPALTGHVLCEPCNTKHREYERKKAQTRRANNQCTSCGQRNTTLLSRCLNCRLTDAVRTQRRAEEKMAANLCVRCSRPNTMKRLCDECTKKQSDSMRIIRQRAKQ